MASTPTFRRLIAVFALGALLGMPLASVAGPRVPAQRIEAQEIALEPFARLWSFLTRVWAKEGCHIDPYGRCLEGSQAAPAPITPKNGCSIDPYGLCTSGSTNSADAGCGIDPYGCTGH